MSEMDRSRKLRFFEKFFRSLICQQSCDEQKNEMRTLLGTGYSTKSNEPKIHLGRGGVLRICFFSTSFAFISSLGGFVASFVSLEFLCISLFLESPSLFSN